MASRCVEFGETKCAKIGIEDSRQEEALNLAGQPIRDMGRDEHGGGDRRHARGDEEDGTRHHHAHEGTVRRCRARPPQAGECARHVER